MPYNIANTESMNFEKVVSIIKDAAGTKLTADVVDAFMHLGEKGELCNLDDEGDESTESIEYIRNDKTN